MPRQRPTRWIMLSVVIAVSGIACSVQSRPAALDDGAGGAGGAAQEAPMGRLDRNRDLCLFGKGNFVRDLSFAGTAATSVLQHTFTSEGADFDPDVDPDTEHLVFASTRHSRFSHLYAKQISGATLTQLTDVAANDAQPAHCPAGKKIAFASDRAGHWDIWVIEANGRNPIQITNGSAAELHPSWSPDGKRLVYCRINPKDRHGELWIADIDNPGVKRFIGEGLFPEWSPKGDKIAYQRARARGSRWFSIWTLDIEGDEVLYPTEIASRPDAALIAPAWSPDGTQLAFTSVIPDPESGAFGLTGGGRSDIGIVDVDGRGLQRLTGGRGKHYSPVWGRKGRIYFSAKLAASETIWSIRVFAPAITPEPPEAPADRRAAAAMKKDWAE